MLHNSQCATNYGFIMARDVAMVTVPTLLLLISHLPFVIHHVPDDLKVPQVIIAQQLVLLSGVEQREVLHNDGCRHKKRY